MLGSADHAAGAESPVTALAYHQANATSIAFLAGHENGDLVSWQVTMQRRRCSGSRCAGAVVPSLHVVTIFATLQVSGAPRRHRR